MILDRSRDHLGVCVIIPLHTFYHLHQTPWVHHSEDSWSVRRGFGQGHPQLVTNYPGPSCSPVPSHQMMQPPDPAWLKPQLFCHCLDWCGRGQHKIISANKDKIQHPSRFCLMITAHFPVMVRWMTRKDPLIARPSPVHQIHSVSRARMTFIFNQRKMLNLCPPFSHQ